MKLIRIGSSQSCDIVLNSKYVSSLHAELTVLDDGKIILEDKNSRNGTTVGNKPVEPDTPMTIQRGDKVMFADEPLVWARVPMPEKLTGFKRVMNIGSNFRNDIILNSPTVSRYHGSLRIKGNKAFIHDNGSKNGTLLNGVKIEPGKDVRIKKGDSIQCGSEDITEQIKAFIPNNIGKIAAISAACVAALALLGVGAYALWGKRGAPVPSQPSGYQDAVVFLLAGFHTEITFDDDAGSGLVARFDAKGASWKDDEDAERQPIFIQATAFFIDREGRMVTNKHTAAPWDEYLKKAYDDDPSITWEEYMKQQFEKFWPDRLEVSRLMSSDPRVYNQAVRDLKMTEVGRKLLNGCNSPADLGAKITRLFKSKVKIQGYLDYIAVGYPGHKYTAIDEFQRCDTIAVANDPNVDLAVLQLNDKKTPDHIKYVFDIKNWNEKTLVPQKDVLYTIGYPAGLMWGQDEKSDALAPSLYDTKCSQMPTKYEFQIQNATIGGSSGSPVFNKKGELVGILYGTYDKVASKAIQVKFLKKLYDEEVKLFAPKN
jgi:pSer/pThr/pTyr-binding forkhead associated (FHA) protein/V8-like Glu-specific endopeptidase